MGLLNGYIRTVRYRLVDGNYIKQSEWTSSNDVEMDIGITLENKMSSVDYELSRISNNITSTSDSLSLLNQDVKEIKVVTALPSDAASHTTTLYVLINE